MISADIIGGISIDARNGSARLTAEKCMIALNHTSRRKRNDMKAELCKTCIHTNVCLRDKNIIGDVFVAGHLTFFDNQKLYEEYERRKAAGFPCKDYLSNEDLIDRRKLTIHDGWLNEGDHQSHITFVYSNDIWSI